MRALRLTVFVGEDDRWRHTPVYHEIVRRAHLVAEGMAVLDEVEVVHR